MNRSIDDLLNRYYETLQQGNSRGREQFLAELAVASPAPRNFKMNRSRTRVAVAVLLAASVVLSVIGLNGMSTTSAWAAMADVLQNLKNVRYKYSVMVPGNKTSSGRYLILSPGRFREETSGGSIRIVDYDAGRILNLEANSKQAVVFELTDMPKDECPNDFLESIRQDLLNDKVDENTKRESLGKKKLAGLDAVGYRIIRAERTTEIWGDPASGMPIQIEITKDKYLLPGATVTLSDFEFNATLDESLFSVTPPADNEVQVLKTSLAEPTEKELVDALDTYSQLAKGSFPQTLDARALQDLAEAMGYDKELPQGQAMDEWMELCMKLNRGFAFALGLLAESEATYAGTGAQRGTSEQAIFWYKPVGAKKYRVVGVDLKVRESDVEPAAENAKRLGGVDAAGKPD